MFSRTKEACVVGKAVIKTASKTAMSGVFEAAETLRMESFLKLDSKGRAKVYVIRMRAQRKAFIEQMVADVLEVDTTTPERIIRKAAARMFDEQFGA